MILYFSIVRRRLYLAALCCFSSFALSAQTAAIADVYNNASFDTRLSPGVLAAVYGTNLGTSESTVVTVAGQPAAVLYASATQFSIEIPIDLPAGSTTIQVGNSAAFPITLTQYAPGLYSVAQNGMGLASAFQASGSAVNEANPATPGETISIFATGLGATNPAVANGAAAPSSPPAVTVVTPTVTIGGVSATVVSSALQANQIGVYQINVEVPASGLTNGDQALVLAMNGSPSNTLELPIGSAVANAVPTIGGVVSATGIPGSVQPNMESGSWVAIYGSNLAGITRDWSGEIVNGNLPTSLAETGVTFNGKLGYVYFISPNQIDVQAPDGLSGAIQVVVTNKGQSSAPATATAADLAPALFQWGPTKYAVATRYPNNAYVANPTLGSSYVEAKPGDVLILWATGFGPTSPASAAGAENAGSHLITTMISVTVGGETAIVVGAALSPGLAGVYQVAIQLPANTPSGDVLIQATIGGVSTPNNMYLFVAGS
jgi:uncharacterized protein (TIGR03437 family)